MPTMRSWEEIEKIREAIKRNPGVAQYLVRSDFEQLAARNQEELDALNEYNKLYASRWSSYGGYPSLGEYTPEVKARMAELEPIVSRLKGGGETGISETFWTEGGAGYQAPEAPVAQPSLTGINPATGEPYEYWGGGGITAPTGAMATQAGIPPMGTPPSIPQYEVPPYQTDIPQYEVSPYQPPDLAQWPEQQAPFTGVGLGAGAGAPIAGEVPIWWTGSDEEYFRWYREYYEPMLAGEYKLPPPEAGVPPTTQWGEEQYPPGTLTYPGEEPPWYKPWEEATPGGVVPGFFASPYDVPPELWETHNIVYDPTMMAWRADPKAPGAGNEFEEWYMREKLALDQQAQALRQQQQEWEQAQAGQLTEWQRQQLDLEEQRLEESREMTEYQAAQLRQQQEYQTWQMGETERQYASQLAARGPGAWMETAAYTGREPAVQPWQVPLMPEQYGLQAGQPIPGWTAETAQGMPEMTRPSRQYQARMGPTAMAQLGSYRQARTGATPEETQWRQWSVAPPGGRGGLSYVR